MVSSILISSVNSIQVYIADVTAIVIAGLLLTNKAWRTGLITKEKRIFEVLIVFTLISCIFDAFNFGLDGKDLTEFERFIFVFSNYWMFLSNIVIGPLWVALVIIHTTGKPLNKTQKIIDIVLCSTGACIIIANLFVPIVFSIDENNIYTRGPLYLVFTAIQSLFMIDGLIVYFHERKKNKNLKHFPVLQFLIPFIIGAIIQVTTYGVSTLMLFLVISITGIVIGISNENEEKALLLKDKQKDLLIIADQKVQLEKQQDALEKAADMANAANKAKTAFLNNMSHDIRTPMNAIIGYTGLAETHIDDKEKVKDYLAKITQSSTHLLSLINDVLDMSRIESGKMTINESEENVIDIAQTLENIVRADVAKKDLHFTLDVSNVKNANASLDKLHLNQVLLNIISNSVKYTQKGGDILFSVSEKESQKPEHVTYEFIIKDNGMGMSEEFLKTIFEPFTRVNSSTVSGIQGTGLGMAITKELIDMMGGTISIKSKENEGTETTINFDFRIIDKTKNIVEEENTAEYNFNGKKILLVEDNELNREIATEILQEDGFIIDTAEDGTIAVEKMQKATKDTYDAILMDIQMPIMNGYEATKQIRQLQDKDVANVIIIAMTANAFEEDKKEALAAGMNDYIPKPVNIDQMKKVLAKYLNN